MLGEIGHNDLMILIIGVVVIFLLNSSISETFKLYRNLEKSYKKKVEEFKNKLAKKLDV